MDEAKTNDPGILLKDYLKVRYELLELQLIRKTAGSGAGLIATMIIIVVLLMSAIFLSLAFAFFLYHILHSYMLSFLLIGSIYLLLGLLFALFRTSLLARPLRNRIVKELTGDKQL
ncbi:MAG: phage holin family protein [Bacteroidota bacterium]